MFMYQTITRRGKSSSEWVQTAANNSTHYNLYEILVLSMIENYEVTVSNDIQQQGYISLMKFVSLDLTT